MTNLSPDVPNFLQLAKERPQANCPGARAWLLKNWLSIFRTFPLPKHKTGWPHFGNSPQEALFLLSCFGESPKPVFLEPGTIIYRVVGATRDQFRTNNYSGEWWSSIPLPHNEEDWRSDNAVRNDWNGDGGYIEYEVGKFGLKVWIGIAGPQVIRYNKSYLQGGQQQIWVPKDTINPLIQGQSKKEVTQRTPWNII